MNALSPTTVMSSAAGLWMATGGTWVDSPACPGCRYAPSPFAIVVAAEGSPVGYGETRWSEPGAEGGDSLVQHGLFVLGLSARLSWEVREIAPDGSFGAVVLAGEWAGPGDVNLDGFVDGLDADLFTDWWLKGDARADFNLDGAVDGLDYDAFVNAWRA